MTLVAIAEGDYVTVPVETDENEDDLTLETREKLLEELEARMRDAARKFEFEEAARIRDKIKRIRAKDIAGAGIPV
jgi:excinuclease ABC subunit B